MFKKNALIFTLVATLVIAIIPSFESSAKDTGWKNAYLELVNALNEEDMADGKSEYGYELIYFNKDSIPELLVGVSGYWVSMYTYKKGNVYQPIEQWAYGAWGNHGYNYLPKKNCLFNTNADYAGAVYYTTYMKMKNQELVSMYDKDLVARMFSDQNGNGYPDDNEYYDDYKYYYGDKEISAEEFASFGKKGNYKMMDPKKSYGKIIKKF